MAAARHLEKFVAGETQDLGGYRREVELGLVSDIAVSQRFHDVCHFWPGLVVNLEILGNFLIPHAFKIINGELSFSQIRNRNKRFMSIVKFISDAVRVTPPLRRIGGVPKSMPVTGPQRTVHSDS